MLNSDNGSAICPASPLGKGNLKEQSSEQKALNLQTDLLTFSHLLNLCLNERMSKSWNRKDSKDRQWQNLLHE